MNNQKICNKCGTAGGGESVCAACGESFAGAEDSGQNAFNTAKISPVRLGYSIFYIVSLAVLFVLSLVFMYDFRGFLLIFYFISLGIALLEVLWILKPETAERVFGVLAYFGASQTESKDGGAALKIKPSLIIGHLIFLIFSHGTMSLALIYGLLA